CLVAQLAGPARASRGALGATGMGGRGLRPVRGRALTGRCGSRTPPARLVTFHVERPRLTGAPTGPVARLAHGPDARTAGRRRRTPRAPSRELGLGRAVDPHAALSSLRAPLAAAPRHEPGPGQWLAHGTGPDRRPTLARLVRRGRGNGPRLDHCH